MSNTDVFIEQTFEFWLEEFKPIANHLDDNASFENEEGNGIMFETYGEELEFVKAQDPRCVWTYGDGDDGGSYIWNGYHYINRLGYFITEVPCPENTEIQVQVSEQDYYCEGCGEEWFGEAAELIKDTLLEINKCPACATMEEIKEYGYAEENE